MRNGIAYISLGVLGVELGSIEQSSACIDSMDWFHCAWSS